MPTWTAESKAEPERSLRRSEVYCRRLDYQRKRKELDEESLDYTHAHSQWSFQKLEQQEDHVSGNRRSFGVKSECALHSDFLSRPSSKPSMYFVSRRDNLDPERDDLQRSLHGIAPRNGGGLQAALAVVRYMGLFPVFGEAL